MSQYEAPHPLLAGTLSRVRISNSISELQLTGTPTKALLDPWEGWVYSALSLAFGVGIWLSARGSRSLRVVGALMMLPAASIPLWLLFGEANLAAHLALAVMGILSWLGAMAFGAAALGKRFGIYSLVSLAVVVAFNALALCTHRRSTRATQHLHWARRADRIRHVLLMAVGACGGPLAAEQSRERSRRTRRMRVHRWAASSCWLPAPAGHLDLHLKSMRLPAQM